MVVLINGRKDGESDAFMRTGKLDFFSTESGSAVLHPDESKKQQAVWDTVLSANALGP